MLFLEAVGGFLEDQEYKGNSPGTVSYYRERLERFGRETGAEALSDFNEVSVRRWLMSKRGVSRNTVANYDRALRVFSNWLARQGYVSHSPIAKLPKPRETPTQVTTFGYADLMKIMHTAKQGGTPLRDQALITVLVDTGIRIGEACNLKLRDIIWTEGHLKVSGKTGPRTVPFGRKCKAALKRYIDQERTAASPHVTHVFLLTTGYPLGVERAKQQVTRIVRQAGITTGKAGPHQFRHLFAVEFIRAGGDAFTLQRILGHTTLDMTRKYVHLTNSDLRAAHRKFAPGDRLL